MAKSVTMSWSPTGRSISPGSRVMKQNSAHTSWAITTIQPLHTMISNMWIFQRPTNGTTLTGWLRYNIKSAGMNVSWDRTSGQIHGTMPTSICRIFMALPNAITWTASATMLITCILFITVSQPRFQPCVASRLKSMCQKENAWAFTCALTKNHCLNNGMFYVPTTSDRMYPGKRILWEPVSA